MLLWRHRLVSRYVLLREEVIALWRSGQRRRNRRVVGNFLALARHGQAFARAEVNALVVANRCRHVVNIALRGQLAQSVNDLAWLRRLVVDLFCDERVEQIVIRVALGDERFLQNQIEHLASLYELLNVDLGS